MNNKLISRAKIMLMTNMASGGSMMLNLNKKPDSFIMKQGRWKSSSFLKYIRNYVSAYGGDASSIIARLDNEFVSFLHM